MAVEIDTSRRNLLGAAALTAVGAVPLWPTLALAAGPVEGQDYKRVPTPQATDDPKKVEVIEFFWYGCGHCNAFEPLIHAWQAKLPANVAFKQVHVDWEGREVHQRTHLALQALGRTDLSTKMFEAIHVDRKPMNKLPAVAELMAKHGIAADQFTKAYQSFGVSTAVGRTKKLMEAYKIESVPMLIVNGKYVTSPSMAGGSNAQALAVVDYLIQLESRGR